MLSSKQRREEYKKNRQLGMSRLNAGIRSGYPLSIISRRTAVSKHSNLTYNDLFEQRGMTRSERVDYIIRGLSANGTVFDKEGRRHEYEDWGSRIKFLDRMLRLTGDIDEKKQVESSTNVIMILQKAQERVDRMKEAELAARDRRERASSDTSDARFKEEVLV